MKQVYVLLKLGDLYLQQVLTYGCLKGHMIFYSCDKFCGI